MNETNIKVTKLFFNTESDQLEIHLADGTSRVTYLMPTGNCWVECWVTPERHEDILARAEAREKEAMSQAERYAFELKKPWWKKL